MKIADFKLQIDAEGQRLRAAADRTENVEQLEAIERDFEKLINQAKRIERLVTSSPTIQNGPRGATDPTSGGRG
jgi:hypothetical protein